MRMTVLGDPSGKAGNLSNQGAERDGVVTLPLYYTHHGPIVKFDRKRHRAYSVKLPNFEGVNYSTNLYGFMTAKNLEEFKAVVGKQRMPKWNLLYSGAQNIYWIHNGTVAKRAEGFDWRKPVPGWLKETEWGPFLPLEVYPQVLNPASGFLQNCNTPHWVVTKNSGLRPLEPASYYLQSLPKADAGEEALNTRGERLFQVLGESRKFTLDDIKELALDTYVLPADVIVPLLIMLWQRLNPKRTRASKGRRASEGVGSAFFAGFVAYTVLHFWGKAYQELFPGRFSRFVSQEESGSICNRPRNASGPLQP